MASDNSLVLLVVLEVGCSDRRLWSTRRSSLPGALGAGEGAGAGAVVDVLDVLDVLVAAGAVALVLVVFVESVGGAAGVGAVLVAGSVVVCCAVVSFLGPRPRVLLAASKVLLCHHWIGRVKFRPTHPSS